jgi:hypothetical protein
MRNRHLTNNFHPLGWFDLTTTPRQIADEKFLLEMASFDRCELLHTPAGLLTY